jgi:hypothetical protein
LLDAELFGYCKLDVFGAAFSFSGFACASLGQLLDNAFNEYFWRRCACGNTNMLNIFEPFFLNAVFFSN